MQAIELFATVLPDHELRVSLPAGTAVGPARVIVLFEADRPSPSSRDLDTFLDELPINDSGGISHEAACERVAEERAAWEQA